MIDSGLYIAVFQLARPKHIEIGRLGKVRFRAGYYLYVGSAQRNLDARINRHSRREKPLRWHIDYLSVKATMLGTILIPGPKQYECEIAGKLARTYDIVVSGFGSSDCRCNGHLFYAQDLL